MTLQNTSTPALEPGTEDALPVRCSRRMDADQYEAVKKMVTERLAEREPAPVIRHPDLVHVGTSWHLKKVGFDKNDVWVGLYWKYGRFYDGSAGDFDALTFYICILPCFLIAFTRVRQWQIIPKVAGLDMLCLDCHVPQSMHRVNMEHGLGCDEFKG